MPTLKRKTEVPAAPRIKRTRLRKFEKIDADWFRDVIEMLLTSKILDNVPQIFSRTSHNSRNEFANQFDDVSGVVVDSAKFYPIGAIENHEFAFSAIVFGHQNYVDKDDRDESELLGPMFVAAIDGLVSSGCAMNIEIERFRLDVCDEQVKDGSMIFVAGSEDMVYNFDLSITDSQNSPTVVIQSGESQKLKLPVNTNDCIEIQIAANTFMKFPASAPSSLAFE